jgi:DNA polymerase III delta subunit
MKIPDMAADLRQSRLHAVIGVSHRLRDEVLDRVISGWAGPVKRHVEPEDLQRLVLDIGTASLFEEPALRLVRAGPAYVKRHRETLLGLVGGDASGGVMVLVTDPPERKDDALFKGLAKISAMHGADEPDGKGMVDWLAGRLGALPHGSDRPRHVAEAMVEALGHDVDALLGASEVLAIYRHDRPVDVAAVHELYANTAARPLWSFVDAVLDGKAGAALEQLHAIGAEKPDAALNALAAELRKVLACLETDDDTEAARAAGIWGRPNLHYTRRRARNLGRSAAMRLLGGTIYATRQLRQGGANPALALETLVLHARKLVPGSPR